MPIALPRFLFNMQDLLLPFGALRSFSLEVVGIQVVARLLVPLIKPLGDDVSYQAQLVIKVLQL